MSAAVLLAGFVAFAACLAVHVALWRLARPRSDMRALFGIFFVAPSAVALLVVASGALAPGAGLPDGLDVAAALLLHWALSAAYVQSYPAVQAVAPSLEIAYAVRRSMPRGLSRHELAAQLNTRALVRDRVEDLVTDRLVRLERDRYVLTPASATLVRFFLGLRALLGLRQPGG
jgi:hypothetical protein